MAMIFTIKFVGRGLISNLLKSAMVVISYTLFINSQQLLYVTSYENDTSFSLVKWHFMNTNTFIYVHEVLYIVTQSVHGG